MRRLVEPYDRANGRPFCPIAGIRVSILMRVAFDVGPVRAEPAGVGLYARAMANALAAELDLGELALIGRRSGAVGLPDGTPALDRSARMPYPAWVELTSARDAQRAGADIVHYADGLAPFIRHGRTVLTIHDLSAFRQWRTHRAPRWARIPLVLLSPRLADLVVVPSRATADEVLRMTHVPADRVEIVPYAPQSDVRPADPAKIADVLTRHGLESGAYILSLGTIEPRKNHLRLIAAFEQLAAKDRIAGEIRLVVAGKPGWGYEPVNRAIAESPVRNRIVQLGYVPGEELPALVTGAGAVAYVSLYEGFGLPVVEALACGAPTVTSNVSSMPEVAGDAGFLVNPYDVPDIARGLAAALEAGAVDGAGVRQRAIAQASTFSWARAAERCVELYRALG